MLKYYRELFKLIPLKDGRILCKYKAKKYKLKTLIRIRESLMKETHQKVFNFYFGRVR